MPRLLVWIVAAIVALLLLDAGYAGLRGGTSLLGARSDLLTATSELREGEIESARAEFREAEDRLSDARSAFDHPGYWVMSRLPFVSRDARAANVLAEAASGVARAGRDALVVADELGSGEGGLGSGLISEGRIMLGRLRTMSGSLEPLLDEVTAAHLVLADAPRPNLGVVREAVLAARERVTGARLALERGLAVSRVADEIFGAAGRRRYLLAFQSPSEARGSGGFLGLFGVLNVRDGAIEIRNITAPPEPLLAPLEPEIEPVDVPPWFDRKYGPEGSRWNSSESNLSPHFPTVAEVLIEMFEQVRGVRYDGVVALDPNGFASFMEATGPIDLPGLGPVDDENVAQTIMRDSYVDLTPEEQSAALEVLLDEFFGRLRQGDLNAPAFLRGVGDAAATGRLKFYVTDEEAARGLATARVDGDFTHAGPMQQLVWHNSDSISKVDWFLHRTTETVVRLEEDGSARVRTRILLDNRAPDGPPSLLLGGRSSGYRPGENRMHLDVMMPVGAELAVFKDGETEIEPQEGNEAGYPSARTRLIMRPGSQRLFEVQYSVASAVEIEGGERFGFTLYPHAAVRPDEFLLTIFAPDGYRLRTTGTFDDPDEFVQLTGRLEEPVTLDVELLD